MTTQELTSRLLLTRPQVAELLGVPETTIDNLHRSRTLRGCQVGKRLMWRPSDAERFVKELQPED